MVQTTSNGREPNRPEVIDLLSSDDENEDDDDDDTNKNKNDKAHPVNASTTIATTNSTTTHSTLSTTTTTTTTTGCKKDPTIRKGKTENQQPATTTLKPNPTPLLQQPQEQQSQDWINRLVEHAAKSFELPLSSLTLPSNKTPASPIPPTASQHHQPPSSTNDDVSSASSLSSWSDRRRRPSTISQLASHCWACHVPLQRSSSKKNNDDQQFCCYVLHTHPLLQVPICSVCSQQVAAVALKMEDNQNNNNNNDHDDHDDDDENSVLNDYCSGCGLHQDSIDDDMQLLLLCDTCPRAFCETCVAQSLGGGRMGMLAVQQLIRNDTTDDWQCPCCKTPVSLQTLQSHLEQQLQQQQQQQHPPVVQTTTTGTTTTTTTTAAATQRRTKEDIMAELAAVEEKKKECELWEQPDYLQSVKDQVRQELERSNSFHNQEELQASVEEEMKRLQDSVQRHEMRLSDMVASLQDELELEHNVDLKECYHTLGLLNGDQEDSAPEPEWKIQADLQLMKQDQAKRLEKTKMAIEARKTSATTSQGKHKGKKPTISFSREMKWILAP